MSLHARYDPKYCRCSGCELRLRALVARNGVRQYAIFCTNTMHRGSFMPKRIAQSIAEPYGLTVEDIPVMRDNRAGCCDGSGCVNCAPSPCEHCGSTMRVELHHWAPYHLFDEDADNWPTAWLCRTCHQQWHRIVTPNMHLKRAG